MSSILEEAVSLPSPVDRTCFIFDQNFGKKEAQPTKSSIETFWPSATLWKFDFKIKLLRGQKDISKRTSFEKSAFKTV